MPTWTRRPRLLTDPLTLAKRRGVDKRLLGFSNKQAHLGPLRRSSRRRTSPIACPFNGRQLSGLPQMVDTERPRIAI